MSSRDLNDPYRAFEKVLTGIFDRLGRLEARAWAGAARTATGGTPVVPPSSGAESVLLMDVHRGKWSVIATGEVEAAAHSPDAAYSMGAAVLEMGTTTPLGAAEVDLDPVVIQPSWTAGATPLRLQAVLLGSIAAEQQFTFALQVSSNTDTQPTWRNLKVVLLPS